MATKNLSIFLFKGSDTWISFTRIDETIPVGTKVHIKVTAPFNVSAITTVDFADKNFSVVSTGTLTASGKNISGTLTITGSSDVVRFELYLKTSDNIIKPYFNNVKGTLTWGSDLDDTPTPPGPGIDDNPSAPSSQAYTFKNSVKSLRDSLNTLILKTSPKIFTGSLSFTGASSDTLTTYDNLNNDERYGTIIIYDFGDNSDTNEGTFNNIMRPVAKMYPNRLSNSTMIHNNVNYAFQKNTKADRGVNLNTGSYRVRHDLGWSFTYSKFYDPFNNNISDYHAYYSFWFMLDQDGKPTDEVSIWIGGPNDGGEGIQGKIDVNGYKKQHWYYAFGKLGDAMFAHNTANNSTGTCAISFSENISGYASDQSLAFIKNDDPDFDENPTSVGCANFIMPSGVY